MAIMTKAEVIERVAAETGGTKAQTLRVLHSIQDTVMEAVADGKEVKLTGFAAFGTTTRSARTTRNPQTGAPVDTPETTVVKIRPLGQFRERVQK